MKTLEAPSVFSEAIGKLSDREVIQSVLRSAEWRDKVAVGLRDRAFFSATLENARVLQTMKDYLEDYLAKAIDPQTGGLRAQGRAEFLADMRELCIREGLGKVDPETGEITADIDEGDLTDLRSTARLQLIFDTQVEQANEYGYWSQGNDPDVLDAFPAQRFIRVRPVRVPRPAHAAAEGTVRRKDDLNFWIGLNPDFGVPWGPWGFNSGMGVEDVDRIESEELGIVKPGQRIASPGREMNDRLSASVRDMSPEMQHGLWESFQGQVEMRDGKAWWAGDRVGKDRANRGMKPTAAMREIIAEYTRSGEPGAWFGEMNSQLRDGKVTIAMGKKSKALREALAALPDVRGTVWRDTGDIGNKESRYRVGTRVVERFFISTTKDKDLGFGKKLNSKVRWRIDCRTGKHIADISRKSHQNEVLIPPDRVFVVLENSRMDDGRLFIHMREEQ